MADLSSDIASSGAEPQSVSSDGQSASARSIPDMIAADVYAGAGKAAARKRRRGLMFSKITTPGPHGLNPSDVGTDWGRNG